MPLVPDHSAHTPLTRRRGDRVLGGVCAALAASRGLSVAAVRAAFVAAGALLGLGVVAYLACWLILPAEGEDDRQRGPRVVVLAARACAAAVGLLALGALGAAATVFGYGWATVAAAGLALLGALAGGTRRPPAWVLLPLGALVLPSVALAAGGVHLDPTSAAQTVTPATATQLSERGLHSGLGPLFVDLRRTRLPASGVVPLRIDAGVRRTIVALPHDRCVRIAVRYDQQGFAARAASVLSGRYHVAPSVSVFGQTTYAGDGVRPATPTASDGPTLDIRFTSQGGGLSVRDYPDAVEPRREVDWPGYEVFLEPRPALAGLGPRRTRYRLDRWRARRADQLRSKRRIDRLLPGPCAAREERR